MGTHNTNLSAGMILVCADGEWRAVCDDGWDQQDARTICRKLNLPQCKYVEAFL